MPILKLHFPLEMVNFEVFEDILGVVNKPIRNEADQFKSRTAWMRGTLRKLAAAYNRSRRQWQSTQSLMLGDGTRKTVAVLPFEAIADLECDDDGLEGELIGLPIGELQFKYLVLATQWENALNKYLGGEAPQFPSVALFCRHLLLSQLLNVGVIIDEEKMKLEDADLPPDDEPCQV